MNIKVAHSLKETPREVSADIKAQFEGSDIKALLYFASSKFDADALSLNMRDQFPGVQTFGCTTAGELVSGKMLDHDIVAMAINSNIIEDMKIAVLPNIRENAKAAVDVAFKDFERHFGIPMAEMNFEKYVGLVLIDGLSSAEESIMERIGDGTNVMFIGGSAGDDLKFAKAHVFENGRAYSNAAVLVLIKALKPFTYLKTQSFEVLDKQLTATAVDTAKRKVLEFNNKPATEAYAEAVGVPVSEVNDYFMRYPVGLMTGDEPFVRSPQLVEDQGIVFYCNILEGMELSLLKSKDIVQDTKQALDDALKLFGAVSGIINFHCILRTLELKQKNQTEEYGRIFSDIPTVGFSTYGEEFLGHINQTSTMLLFS